MCIRDRSAAGHLSRERNAAEDSSSAEMLATLVAGMWRNNAEGASQSFGAERFYFLVAEFQVNFPMYNCSYFILLKTFCVSYA